MASKNSIKEYVENGYYHLYNRGVEKRAIFQDKQDYSVFLSYLKSYLLPKDLKKLRELLNSRALSSRERDKVLKQIRLNNFNDEITLLSYCLMSNHFHLLIKQKSANSIDRFMNSLILRYVMYFNKKYKRVGPLFQGSYKAVLVRTDEQLIYLTSYIHRNPLPKFDNFGSKLQEVVLEAQPSSYLDYLGKRESDWVNCEEVLSFFGRIDPQSSYQMFVEGTLDSTSIEGLRLDDEDSCTEFPDVVLRS